MLQDAIRSIVNQTWTDWELLLYDDGSQEPYSSHLRDAAQMDPRIRYFRCDENRGLAHAMNMCLANARGSLIGRMDDDDLSDPHRLETQVAFLRENPQYAWVGCQAWLFDGDGIWGKGDRPQIPTARDFLKYSPYIHPSVMFRREALDAVGGYYSAPVTWRCEDYELFMRLTAAGYQGYNLPQRLFRYRENRERLTKRRFRYSVNEAIIRCQGFRKMGILSPKNFVYVCKPLAVRLIALAPRAAQQLRTAKYRLTGTTPDPSESYESDS